jgi:hypothetical protein
MTDDTAKAFGLDPDQERGHPDVPFDLDLLDGQRVIVDDGITREHAVLVVGTEMFAIAAQMRREGERMIRIWRAGNLEVWSPPVRRGHPAVVRIRDEEGVTRFEEIRYPVYAALSAAQRPEGDPDA